MRPVSRVKLTDSYDRSSERRSHYFAPNCCDHLCISLTRIYTITILATLALDQYKEKTVASGRSLSILGQERASGA